MCGSGQVSANNDQVSRPGSDGQASSRSGDGRLRGDDNGHVSSRGGDGQVSSCGVDSPTWADNGNQLRIYNNNQA